MKIKEIMTPDPRVATPDTTAAAAAALMLDGDCGILPVVDGGKLVGVVTDRDLFIALGTRGVPASELMVGQVAQRALHVCQPDDDVQDALATMQQYRIRRLPVTGFGGTVVGIVSMNDLILAAAAVKGVRQSDAIRTLQAICAHHTPTPHVTVA